MNIEPIVEVEEEIYSFEAMAVLDRETAESCVDLVGGGLYFKV